MNWVCEICGYIYDPADGDPEGSTFEALPDSWVCPQCGAAKSDFSQQPA